MKQITNLKSRILYTFINHENLRMLAAAWRHFSVTAAPAHLNLSLTTQYKLRRHNVSFPNTLHIRVWIPISTLPYGFDERSIQLLVSQPYYIASIVHRRRVYSGANLHRFISARVPLSAANPTNPQLNTRLVTPYHTYLLVTASFSTENLNTIAMIQVLVYGFRH
jgi:hypothetical protein